MGNRIGKSVLMAVLVGAIVGTTGAASAWASGPTRGGGGGGGGNACAGGGQTAARGGGDGGGGGGGGTKIEVSACGTGSLGSPWTLKSAHDDAATGLTVGEEFEITTPAGHTWSVTFADNGVVFLTDTQTATAAGVREAKMTANQPGVQVMTAQAVDLGTGEVINAEVDLPPLP